MNLLTINKIINGYLQRKTSLVLSPLGRNLQINELSFHQNLKRVPVFYYPFCLLYRSFTNQIAKPNIMEYTLLLYNLLKFSALHPSFFVDFPQYLRDFEHSVYLDNCFNSPYTKTMTTDKGGCFFLWIPSSRIT